MRLLELRARVRHRWRKVQDAATARSGAVAARLFERASVFLVAFVLAGGAILGGMVWVVSMGPLRGLTLDQKFALLQIVGGAIGFTITLFAVAIALEEFRGNRARPVIRAELQTRPVFECPGRVVWEMRWRVFNEGERACQWFSLELAIGWVLRDHHRFPNGNFTLLSLSAPGGGRWVRKKTDRGSPQPTPGGFPGWFYYQSNGEVSVFDHVGAEVGGPDFQIDSPDREIYIWCILRGSGAGARNHVIRLDLQGCKVVEQSESKMPRHRPGAR